jgi:hypothetical protein
MLARMDDGWSPIPQAGAIFARSTQQTFRRRCGECRHVVSSERSEEAQVRVRLRVSCHGLFKRPVPVRVPDLVVELLDIEPQDAGWTAVRIKVWRIRRGLLLRNLERVILPGGNVNYDINHRPRIVRSA